MFSRCVFRSATIPKRLIVIQKPESFRLLSKDPLKVSHMPISYALGLKQQNIPSFPDERSPKKPFGDNIKENIWTIPNGLCALRIGLTPMIAYLVVQQSFLPACLLFTFAGATDLVDGLIARNVPGQKSMLGSILDPIADKLLISVMFVTLTYVDLIPLLLTSVVILRDIALIIGSIVRRYQMLEPPVTMKRFFDPSISTINVKPTQINTVLQVALVSLSIASPVFGYVGHPALMGLGFATGGTTLYSGFQYATGNAIQPVKKKDDEEKE